MDNTNELSDYFETLMAEYNPPIPVRLLIAVEVYRFSQKTPLSSELKLTHEEWIKYIKNGISKIFKSYAPECGRGSEPGQGSEHISQHGAD